MTLFSSPMANDAAKGLTSLRVRLLGTAMGCTALMLAAPAMAQQSPVTQHQTSALAVTTAVAAEDEPLDDPSIVSQDPVAIVSDDDIYTVVDSIVIDEVDAPGLLIDSNGGRAQVLEAGAPWITCQWRRVHTRPYIQARKRAKK